MINATIRVRCISASALKTILELMRDESNAIYFETFHTDEQPRIGLKATISRPTDRSGLGSHQSTAGRRRRT